MHVRPIRHRRGRRTDLMEILRLSSQTDEATSVPDRAMLRRFRRIVSDLGNDLYVALIGERLVGIVQITYRRHITLGLRARVESLVVSAAERNHEVVMSLADLAERRAQRRHCFDLSYTATSDSHSVDGVLAANGWVADGRELRLDLSQAAGSRDTRD